LNELFNILSDKSKSWVECTITVTLDLNKNMVHLFFTKVWNYVL